MPNRSLSDSSQTDEKHDFDPVDWANKKTPPKTLVSGGVF
jgi:hypothetical protein